MAIDKSKIKTVKQLNESLKIGESYVVELTAYCPDHPNVPKEVWHVKREKCSENRWRIIPWD